MTYEGTITRVQRGGGGVTLIVETIMGLRGIALDSATWQAIVTDFGIEQPADMVGWRVEYDPAHGDLEIAGPVYEESDESEDDPGADGYDDHQDGRAE